ncbi:hypothetical protein CCHR01_16792 [Colletotrichum chrysophilum]|uniref:Uncharacterized protein n=1 Tax=Colletotrichum chrysophilum TaxID=1836956 RepID=A0AAD9A390_9PEZI|nr:hypothetical protein CCHR01_16792 [Colletotrichum chrysophilum]
MSTWRDLMCLVGKSNIDFDRTARSIFQHMLLVDYGMVAHPVRVERFFDDQGRPTGDAWKRDWPIWHTICAVVSEMAQSCARVEPDKFIIRSASNWFWRLSFLSPARSYLGARSHFEYDLALMLHHYHTRPTYLQPQEYWKGQTGYQGILQELIEDVPRVGTERLMRKLSVDLNENIDKFVADPAKGKTMKQIAKGIAARYGIELVAPKTRGLGTPLIELYYRNGALKKEEKEEYPCSVQ